MSEAHGRAHGVRVADLAIDAVGLGGAGLITYGVSLIFVPAACIVGGLFLLVGAWLLAGRTA